MVLFYFKPEGLAKQRSDIAITPRTLWSSSTFPTLEWGEKAWSGEGCQKLYKNTNPNVVDYKGLVRAVTSGATTTIRGIGCKLR